MSGTGLVLLVIAALLLFGPNKLPELGRAVGRTFREFKDATQDISSDVTEVKKSEPAQVLSVEQQAEQTPPTSERRLPE